MMGCNFCLSIFIACVGIFAYYNSRPIIWVDTDVQYTEGLDLNVIATEHDYALIKNTPLSNITEEMKEMFTTCDLYNSRHAAITVLMDEKLRFGHWFFGIASRLRSGLPFAEYAATFPKYYRDFLTDLPRESYSFVRDQFLYSTVSTRIFHGNFEVCADAARFVRGAVRERFGYELPEGGTVFASPEGIPANLVHRHPHAETAIIIGVSGRRRFALIDPDCLRVAMKVANVTFYTFDPFFPQSRLISNYDYSCPIVTGELTPGDVLITSLHFAHTFVGLDDDSTVVSFFDKKFHPYEQTISEDATLDTWMDTLGEVGDRMRALLHAK